MVACVLNVTWLQVHSLLSTVKSFWMMQVCNAINAGDNSTDILSRIFAGVSIFYNHTGSVTCFEIEDNLDGIDGWNWQVGKILKCLLSLKFRSGYWAGWAQ